MTQLFNERFEGGTNGTGLSTGNTTYASVTLTGTVAATFDNSTTALGSLSAKIVQTTNFSTALLKSTSFSATTTAYHRVCHRLNAAVSGGRAFVCGTFNSGGTNIGRYAINASQQVELQDNSVTLATSTTTLSTATWYRFEWDCVGTSSVLRIYGSPTATTPLETLSVTSAGNTFDHIDDGIIASSNTATTVWLDESVTDSAATPGPVAQASSGTGSVVFTGAAAPAAATSGAGSVTFTGTGVAAAATSGAGNVQFVGSGNATSTSTAVGAGVGSVVLGGYGAAVPGLVLPPAPVTYTYHLFHTVSNHNVPPVGADTPSREYVPAIYFNDPIPAGENLFVNQLGTVSYEQPVDWADVWTVYLGGHLYTITDAEASRLTAAGFGGTVTTVTSTTPPMFNGGVGPLSGVLVGADPGSGGLVGAGSGFGTGGFGTQGFGV